jgi:hypothetical protein
MKSAKVLDKKRCWKQVVEAKQIIDCIESGLTKGWKNHPAVLMWKGYEVALKYYFNIYLNVSIDKHRIKTMYRAYNYLPYSEIPWWLGNEDFHRAMRSRLIEKDREFYLPLFPNDKGYIGGL